MSDKMSEVTEKITSELLDKKFDRHSIWVWYDPREKYTGIIDDIRNVLEDDGVNVEIYDGSYIELKYKLYEEDPEYDEDWLFYIPESRSDAEWFKDVHKLGKEYRPTVKITDDPASQYLMDKTDEIPNELSDWGADDELLTKAFFTVLFKTDLYNPKEFVIDYLSRSDHYSRLIEKYEKSEEWENILKDRYGIENGIDPIEVAEQILFSEVHINSPIDRFKNLSADKPEKTAKLCNRWQKNDPETYLKYVNQIKNDHNIKKSVTDSNSLEWSSTAFKEIDDGLLELSMEKISDKGMKQIPDIAPKIIEVIESRKKKYWYKDGYADYWDVLDHGFSTIEKASKAKQRIKELEVNELVNEYTSNWWKVDSEYRKYVKSTLDLINPHHDLDKARKAITYHYNQFLKELNRSFSKKFSEDPVIGTSQTSFWSNYVEKEERTAIIFCDALRYELAKDIKKRIRDLNPDTNTDTLSAVIPSITETGMSAHLPGKLSYEVNNKDLEVKLDGKEVKSKSDREEILKDQGFLVNDLKDIRSSSKNKLESVGVEPRVIYSQFIDKMGENLDDDEQTLSQISDHLKNIELVIRKLHSIGYNNFIVTSDHGFLYTERLPDELKVDAPEVDIVKRRFGITTSFLGDQSLISMDNDDVSKLGVEADNLNFVFPYGIACFKVQGGNMRYFHGGISIQEILTPVMNIELELKERVGEGLELEVDFPKTVTNNIVTVELIPKGHQTLSEEREFILRARIDDREVCEPKKVSIGKDSKKEQLKIKSGALRDASRVVFEAVDADSREIIETQKSRIDLVIKDEGFDV